MKNHYDVAIAGGGPAGTMAACDLARSGKKVILFEASDYRMARIGETVAPPINNLLKKHGLWEMFLRDDHLLSWGNRSAWGTETIESSSYIFSPYGNGWHLDRSRFDRMLFEAASQSGASCLLNHKVARVGYDGQFLLELRGDHSHSVCAGFFIDATGRSGHHALGMGGERLKENHLLAHCVLYDGADQMNSEMLVETVRNGWWYSSPVPGNKLMVIYFTDAEGSRKLTHMGWETCLSMAPHTQSMVGNLLINGIPKIVSAGSQLMIRSDWEVPWLACGDAMMAVDPLSSSGIHHAMESGIRAASATVAWLEGDHSLAMEYQKKSRQDYKEYLGLRLSYYSQENRWGESGFWSKQKQFSSVGTEFPLSENEVVHVF